MRFRIGEMIEISTNLHTRFSGLHGEIIHAIQSRYAVTLDKYVVRLNTPAIATETFWDIELKKSQ